MNISAFITKETDFVYFFKDNHYMFFELFRQTDTPARPLRGYPEELLQKERDAPDVPRETETFAWATGNVATGIQRNPRREKKK